MNKNRNKNRNEEQLVRFQNNFNILNYTKKNWSSIVTTRNNIDNHFLSTNKYEDFLNI
jgi:hypothetical protein